MEEYRDTLEELHACIRTLIRSDGFAIALPIAPEIKPDVTFMYRGG